MDKCLYLATKLKRMGNRKVMVISIEFCAFETIPKGLQKILGKLKVNWKIQNIHAIAVLKSIRLL